MSQVIKIAHTIPMGAGGISNLTLTINEKIDRDQFQFNYIVFRSKHEFCDERAQKLGSPKLIVDVENEKNPIIKGIKKIIGTISALKEESIQIMHIDASTPYDVIYAVAAKLAGVKIIIFHAHNDDYERVLNLRNLLMPLFRLLIPFTVTDYIATSEKAAHFLFPSKIVKTKNYMLLKNGIDVDKYVYNEDTRKRYRLKYNLEGKFVVGHVGRFAYAKNHRFLIDVFYEITKILPNSVLLLIGIGELQDSIKNKVNELGIGDKVIFWGATEDVANLLQAMDCFVFPSYFEGLPLATIEAQCSGLPTIVSEAVPVEAEITECIKELSLNESAAFWASSVIDFSNRLVRSSQGEKIRENGFDINEIAMRLEKFYKSKVKF